MQQLVLINESQYDAISEQASNWDLLITVRFIINIKFRCIPHDMQNHIKFESAEHKLNH